MTVPEHSVPWMHPTTRTVRAASGAPSSTARMGRPLEESPSTCVRRRDGAAWEEVGGTRALVSRSLASQRSGPPQAAAEATSATRTRQTGDIETPVVRNLRAKDLMSSDEKRTALGLPGDRLAIVTRPRTRRFPASPADWASRLRSLGVPEDPERKIALSRAGVLEFGKAVEGAARMHRAARLLFEDSSRPGRGPRAATAARPSPALGLRERKRLPAR